MNIFIRDIYMMAQAFWWKRVTVTVIVPPMAGIGCAEILAYKT
jgi:hypothetical protein